MHNYYQPFVIEGEDDQNVELLDDDQRALVSCAVDEWITFTASIEEKREQSSENWQAYLENKPRETGLQNPNDLTRAHANIRTGALASTLDGMHAQLCMAAYPAGTQYSDPKPRNKLSKKHKQDYERLCQLSAQRLDQLIYAYQDVKQLLLDGTSAVWHPWVRIEKKKPYYMAANGMVDPNADDIADYSELVNSEMKKVYRDAVEVEGTGFYPLSFEDWRIDPTVESIDDTPFLWKRWVYPDDIKDIDSFVNTDELVPYHDYIFDDTYTLEKLNYQGVTGAHEFLSHMGHDGDDSTKYPMGMICLMEKWGDFYINGKLYRNHVLVFSNDRVFHYFGPNPYDHQQKPFTISPFIPIPGSLYGKTSISDAVPLMHTIDTLVNQGLDVLSASADAAYQYNPNDTALKEWVSKHQSIAPGDMVPVSIPNGLQSLATNLQSLGVINQVMIQMREMMRDTTGGVPYATGGVTSGDQRTLGEVEILASATNSRFQSVLQTYERYRLQRFVLQEFENYRQYMSEPVEIDEEGDIISPNIVKLLDFDFEITGSRTVLNKSRSLQDMRDALAIVPSVVQSGVAQLKQSPEEIDVMPIVKEMFATLGVSTDQVFGEKVDQTATLGGQNDTGAIQQPITGGAAGAMATATEPAGLPPIDVALPEGF